MYQIVLLFLNALLIWLGLDLFLSPREYKLFGASLAHPTLARSPIRLIRGVGIFLSAIGLIILALYANLQLKI